MKTRVVAGIDIGGTKIAVSIQTLEGIRESSFRLPTETDIEPQALLEKVFEKIESELLTLNLELLAIGIGCPGPLDIKNGLVLSPTNLQNWIEFPLVQIVKDRFGVPTVLDNDANAAALGECYFGAGKGVENVLYVTVSTGIGGAIICEGKIHHGVGASAGEIGHTVVNAEGEFCLCGTRGCLETIGSGKSIVRNMRERMAAGEKSTLNFRNADRSDITTEMVVEAVKTGDKLASSVWDEACRFLAIGIGNAITTFAPNAVIIGGGVAQAGDLLFKPLMFYLNQNVNMLPLEEVSIIPASLRGESGVLGAAKMAELLAAPQILAETAI